MLENWLMAVLGPRITEVIIPDQMYLGFVSFSILAATLILKIIKETKDDH